jgi:hypothetical protein
MMHTTDGDGSWCKGADNQTWCNRYPDQGVEDFVDHLTPAYKFLEQVECDPNRHTVAQWCGLKGQVQDMIDAGTDPASGQLSPGLWMNNCIFNSDFPDGVTAQGWTQKSLRGFLVSEERRLHAFYLPLDLQPLAIRTIWTRSGFGRSISGTQYSAPTIWTLASGSYRNSVAGGTTESERTMLVRSNHVIPLLTC